MLKRPALRGFSLIELMVAIAVFSILLAAAIPSFSGWVANTRVRTLADTLQNGLRIAQVEATRRNRQTVFALTDKPPGLNAQVIDDGENWFVRVLPALAGETVDSSYFVQGGRFGARAGVRVDGPAAICFNSMGRLVANGATGLAADCAVPADAAMPTTYALSAAGADRPLAVQVFVGGNIRLCNPAKTQSAAQPDGC